MKRILSILILFVSMCARAAFLTWGNGDVWTIDQSSYDTFPYVMSGSWMAGAIVCLNPTVTNLWVSGSESGANWEGQFEVNQEKYYLPEWAWAWNLGASNRNLMLPNDNAAFHSNDVITWGTNLATTPILFWNGTAKTNEGYASQRVAHFFTGGIDNNDVNAKGRQDACTNLSNIFGTTTIPLYYQLNANGFADMPFNPGGHPDAGQHLEMALFQLTDLNIDTNIWSFSVDYSAVSATTNHCTISSLSKIGNSVSFTLKLDRQQFAWDVPDGTVTNDATTAFTNMPFLGNAFNCIVQGVNFPDGNYNIILDGHLVDTCSSSQLASGRNWFTNYTTQFWKQAVAVKNCMYDLRGADHVTLAATHNAGSLGSLGIPDLINFQSLASNFYDTQGHRGSQLVSDMNQYVGNLWQYMNAGYVAAAQTNHTLSIVKSSKINSPKITVGTLQSASITLPPLLAITPKTASEHYGYWIEYKTDLNDPEWHKDYLWEQDVLATNGTALITNQELHVHAHSPTCFYRWASKPLSLIADSGY